MESVTTRATWLIGKRAARVHTITADNGTEFHDYKNREQQTGVCFYFANPHHSWERGTNENTNGLARQHLPKGTSMQAVTQLDCSSNLMLPLTYEQVVKSHYESHRY